MAVQHGRKTRVLVDEFDLSSYFQSVGTPRQDDAVETTVFRKDDKTYIPGLGSGSASLAGLFDGDVDAVDEELAASLGDDAGRVVTVSPEGIDAVSQRAKLLKAKTTQYEIASAHDDAVRITAAVGGDGGLHGGPVLDPLTAKTATGNESAVDNSFAAEAITIVSSSVANPSVITTSTAHGYETGDVVEIAGHTGSTPSINGSHVVTRLTATTYSIPVNVTIGGTGGTSRRTSTRDGAVAHLHCTAFSGTTPTLDAKVQHSVDATTWVDLITFAQLTGKGKERKTSTGIVNRHLRATRTIAGTTPSFTYAIAAARIGA